MKRKIGKICAEIGVNPVTMRNSWCKAIENEGYEFDRDDSGNRLVDEIEEEGLRQFAANTRHTSLKSAAKMFVEYVHKMRTPTIASHDDLLSEVLLLVADGIAETAARIREAVNRRRTV